MSVSKLLPASGANDFNLNITGPTTTVTFDKEYASGSYSIVSSAADPTTDIYAYNAAGTLVGYTSTKAFTASGGFNKLVVLGGTTGDVLGFTYKKTFTTSATTSEITAGPVITSITPSAMPNVNDTITVTGANFASNVAVTFTGTGYSETAAKNIVRSNSTTLIVTRPDNFPISGSPYTITVSNPGVPNPTGSNSHILANSVTAGVVPVWVTGIALPVYTRNVAYSTTVSATDADGGSVTYSVVSNTLPTGLSFNTTTATISGTPTVLTSGGITIRATDSGGNSTDRAFTIANIGANAPVWTTAAGALTSGGQGSAYSFQLAATDDSGAAPVYSIASGALPTGLTLSSSGLISGTPSAAGTFSFTVNATDANGSATARAFSIFSAATGGVYYATPGTYTWTAPAGVQSVSVVAIGGGGAGAAANTGNAGAGAGLGWKNNISVTAGNTYTVVVGAGGTGPSTPGTWGPDGGQSYFISNGTVAGFGGQGGRRGESSGEAQANGGSYVGDGGGNGGAGGWEPANTSGPGGGGAGGYSGAGGAGGSAQSSSDGNRSGWAGSGGGGGGGSGGGDTTGLQGGGGGGVDVYGQGSSGAGGTGAGNTSLYGGKGGGGGSGGSSGGNSFNDRYYPAGDAGLRGGGGGGTNDAGSGTVRGGNGGNGGVRIIWGIGRSFPSTNVTQNFGGISETII